MALIFLCHLLFYNINMRIGLFTDTYLPDLNGCVQSIVVLKDELIKQGHDVYIVCPYAGIGGFKFEGNIIRIPGIKLKILYDYTMSSPFHFEYIEEFRKLKLDIIHSETEFGIGLYANAVAHILNIPLVRTYHTDYINYTEYFNFTGIEIVTRGMRDVVSAVTRLYGNDCLVLMTPSNKTKKVLESINIKVPVKVVPNAIDLERFNKNKTSQKEIESLRKELNIKEDEKCFVYIGRIAEEKRVELLLNAFRRIKEKKLKAKLVLIGFGPELEKLEKLNKKYGLEDYVKFLGKKDNKDVPKYYHMADSFISASLSETQGLTYIEAMASSLPIIVAYDEVLEDLVVDKENGFFFNDEDSLCETIEQFINLPKETIEKMATSAKNSTKKYSPRIFGNSTIDIYKNVIKEYKESYRLEKTTLKDDTVIMHLKNRMNEIFKVSVSLDSYYEKGYRDECIILKDEYEKLKKAENEVLAYRSALRKLAIKDYSSYNLKKSLTSKFDLSDDEINNIINKLIEMNLINDDKYVENKINILKNGLLSKKSIYEKIIKDGIEKDLIDKYYGEEIDDEYDKCLRKANKYLLLVKNKSLNMKKQLILTKLISDGFSIDDSKKAVNDLDYSIDILLEGNLLKIEAEKYYLKYKTKYSGTELRNKVFNRLLSKEFNYDAIYAVMNEMEF